MNKVQWWVEFNFSDGKPNEIKFFNDKAEADKFAETLTDGKVVKVEFL